MFGVGVGIRVGGRTAVSGGYDPDAQAFFDRVATAGGTLTTTEKNATNQLVLDMKSYGIWSAMKAVYPMVGASAAACAQNLKSSSFTGTFSSGWTFASTGVTPNGTSAYMNTGLVPSSALQLNSVSHSVYSRSLSPTGIMGGVNDAVAYLLLNNATSTTIASQLNTIGADFITGTITNSQGLLMANRTDSTTVNAWRNSTKVATDSKMSTFRPTLSYFIGSRNNGGSAGNYDAKQYGFYHIGDGLTDTEATALYNAVQTFQTTLSRQV